MINVLTFDTVDYRWLLQRRFGCTIRFKLGCKLGFKLCCTLGFKLRCRLVTSLDGTLDLDLDPILDAILETDLVVSLEGQEEDLAGILVEDLGYDLGCETGLILDRDTDMETFVGDTALDVNE